MKKVIHKADTRGRSLYDWLDSHHTFSFGRILRFGTYQLRCASRIE